jgi:ATP phosphoribosyltransferase regulatory subunit
VSGLRRLATLAGDAGVLEDALRAFAERPATLGSLQELRSVIRALDEAGLGAHVAVDLAEVRGLDYYTGLVFRAFAPALGFDVGGGGRYDGLLARYGRPLPAVGFMLGLDRVALLLDRQGARPVAAPPPAEDVVGGGLGVALARARARRATGTRVRFGGRA